MCRWRRVVGFPKYWISDDGVVKTTHRRSMSPGGILKLAPDKDGYLIAGLWDDNSKHQVRRRVASLVLEAFIGPRPEGMQACHRDGVVDNNRLVNLRWDTPSGNHADSVRLGTHPGFLRAGEANPFAKLTRKKVDDIRARSKLGRRWRSQRILLAAEYGITAEHLAAILRGDVWR